MALTDGLAEVPPTPPEIRDASRALLDDIGVEALHARLTDRDPLTASRLRSTDPQRVLRAFEVFEATGRPLAEWQSAPADPVLKDKRIAAFVLDPPRPELRARIAARFEAMVDQGGLEEAQCLQGLDPGLPAAKLLGLRPLQALAAGTLTRAEALDAAITATRQFAKRQMTWFRHRMPHYIWYDPLVSNLITQYGRISA
jgi:tRNA dimethylallyltransferase